MSQAMEYYFSPLACSFAGHVLIREAGLEIAMRPVSLRRKETDDGRAFADISAKSQVPVLKFGDGRILTENSAVLQVLADMAPERLYLPDRSTPAGQSTLEWVNYVATEVHKLSLYPVFSDGVPSEVKRWARENLEKKLAFATARLSRSRYLAGDTFTIADAYFGWALMLTLRAGLWKPADGLLAYWNRLLERPAFTGAIEVEEELFEKFA
ncbi:hypothetical protein FN976_26995 [Caenimonas sedimenti]|uniref:Glutathione S-transferase n=1 Tax=Caenimonas sedimenti TaxID=2596921 RepID=A0A562ZFI6_9BURK|nr:glutathione binding-like protein [Caenimonas sedimenti]TWO66028.1 hypothetical protein FN976_26995 [Caenimonas sedimenti]